LFINTTFQAIKSSDSTNICLYLNNETFPVDLQIYLIADVCVRLMNSNIQINNLTWLVNRKYSDRILDDVFIILKNNLDKGLNTELRSEILPEIQEKIQKI